MDENRIILDEITSQFESKLLFLVAEIDIIQLSLREKAYKTITNTSIEGTVESNISEIAVNIFIKRVNKIVENSINAYLLKIL